MNRVSIDNTPKVRAKPTLRRLDDAARAEQQARFLQLRVNIIKAEQCGIFSAEAAHEARRAVALETARQMREAREVEKE